MEALFKYKQLNGSLRQSKWSVFNMNVAAFSSTKQEQLRDQCTKNMQTQSNVEPTASNTIR